MYIDTFLVGLLLLLDGVTPGLDVVPGSEIDSCIREGFKGLGSTKPPKVLVGGCSILNGL